MAFAIESMGVLIGNITGEAMHTYVQSHGWTSYAVCSTATDHSVALLVPVGSKRVHPPTGVDQRLLDEDVLGDDDVLANLDLGCSLCTRHYRVVCRTLDVLLRNIDAPT